MCMYQLYISQCIHCDLCMLNFDAFWRVDFFIDTRYIVVLSIRIIILFAIGVLSGS